MVPHGGISAARSATTASRCSAACPARCRAAAGSCSPSSSGRDARPRRGARTRSSRRGPGYTDGRCARSPMRLAAAAVRWRDDPEVRAELRRTTDLSPVMLDAVLPLVAEPIDADALVELHAREGEAHGPALIAHVLAVERTGAGGPGDHALVHRRRGGGREVRTSGPCVRPGVRTSRREVDPDLGADDPRDLTGRTRRPDYRARVVLAAADVVTINGTNEAIAAVSRRTNARIVAHGARTSVALMRDYATDAEIAALALDRRALRAARLPVADHRLRRRRGRPPGIRPARPRGARRGGGSRCRCRSRRRPAPRVASRSKPHGLRARRCSKGARRRRTGSFVRHDR